MRYSNLVATAAAFTLVSSFALAAGTHDHNHGPDIGKIGNEADVTRTVTIIMKDNYYEPETLDIKEGETVKFIVKNEGEFVHEFNIGTAEMHLAHQEEMEMMVDHGVLEIDKINYDAMQMEMVNDDGTTHTMEHDDPNSVLLEPGKTAEIIWSFDTDEVLEFACNIPGHYDSGMSGNINLTE